MNSFSLRRLLGKKGKKRNKDLQNSGVAPPLWFGSSFLKGRRNDATAVEVAESKANTLLVEVAVTVGTAGGDYLILKSTC